MPQHGFEPIIRAINEWIGLIFLRTSLEGISGQSIYVCITGIFNKFFFLLLVFLHVHLLRIYSTSSTFYWFYYILVRHTTSRYSELRKFSLLSIFLKRWNINFLLFYYFYGQLFYFRFLTGVFVLFVIDLGKFENQWCLHFYLPLDPLNLSCWEV